MAGYPSHLMRERCLADGRTVVIRPVRPEDLDGMRRFFAGLSAEAKRMRFMKFVHDVNERMLHAFTHIDYEKQMAFVCEARIDGEPRIVGDARYGAIPGTRSCEFGVVIADAWHKSGIAGLLMAELIGAARAGGYETMESLALRENAAERRFAKALGFEERPSAEDPGAVRTVKRL